MKEPWKHRLKRWAYEFPMRCHPYWMFMMYPYDYEWDMFLETAMDLNMVGPEEGPLTYRGRSTMVLMVGSQEIWASNYPFAYGQRYSDLSRLSGRPSYRNMRRLRKIQRQIVRKENEENNYV